MMYRITALQENCMESVDQLSYRGFTILLKNEPATYFYDERISCVPEELPHVAEVYYPDGAFMCWVSSPHGMYASARAAALAVKDYLAS